MRWRWPVVIGAVVAVAIAVGASTAGAAAAVGAAPPRPAVVATGEDSDGPDADGPDAQLGGTELERATAAALKHTGGGTVTDTEIGDDGAAYGVEVRKPDGTEVEVHLDKAFTVTGEEIDD
ncbi:MAG: hypothetical protein L0K86_09365 [Actinomycetia bacterium]|nr:hypothetical protein [Actinomycetes bacterium]